MTVLKNLFLITNILAVLLFSGCSNDAQPGAPGTAIIQVTSPAFAAGQPISDKYTCHGDDVSPPLQWHGAPQETKSFVIICEDPDAPGGTFTHWMLYDVPSATVALSENVAKTGSLPDGSKQGKNSFGNIGYNGPCPPAGKPHRYFFRVYALDATLGLDSGVDRSDLLNAMNGHILARGEWMGTYQVTSDK